MFCKYCGKTLRDESKFCKYCGKQLGKNAKTKAPKQPLMQQEKTKIKHKKKLTIGTIIGIVSGGVAVVAVVIVLVIMLGGGQSTSSVVNEATAVEQKESSTDKSEVFVEQSEFYGEWRMVGTRNLDTGESGPIVGLNTEYKRITDNSIQAFVFDVELKVIQTLEHDYVYKGFDDISDYTLSTNIRYNALAEVSGNQIGLIYLLDNDGYLLVCHEGMFDSAAVYEKRADGTIDKLLNE